MVVAGAATVVAMSGISTSADDETDHDLGAGAYIHPLGPVVGTAGTTGLFTAH
jgi:hypothetical protein